MEDFIKESHLFFFNDLKVTFAFGGFLQRFSVLYSPRMSKPDYFYHCYTEVNMEKIPFILLKTLVLGRRREERLHVKAVITKREHIFRYQDTVMYFFGMLLWQDLFSMRKLRPNVVKFACTCSLYAF